MLTAKDIVKGKMQAVQALNLKPGDFVFYIGKWVGKVNAFIQDIDFVKDKESSEILKVKVKLDSGELSTLNPSDHVICVQEKKTAA